MRAPEPTKNNGRSKIKQQHVTNHEYLTKPLRWNKPNVVMMHVCECMSVWVCLSVRTQYSNVFVSMMMLTSGEWLKPFYLIIAMGMFGDKRIEICAGSHLISIWHSIDFFMDILGLQNSMYRISWNVATFFLFAYSFPLPVLSVRLFTYRQLTWLDISTRI